MSGFEKVGFDQQYLSFPPYTYRTKEQALSEVSRPCGRFLSPLTLEERIGLFTSSSFGNLDMLSNATYVLASGMPLNWLVILRYLHQKGVITEPRCTFIRRRTDLPMLHGLGLNSPWNPAQTDGVETTIAAFASSPTFEGSISRVVGEILERHILTRYSHSSFTRASYRELTQRGYTAVPVPKLNSFLPFQEALNPRFVRSEDTPLYWVEGTAIDGAPVHIPAQLVFWNYNHTLDTDAGILQESNTNGAAGHFTKDEAILAGLLETIERDGFLMYWLNGLSPRVISVAEIEDEEIQSFLANLARYGVEAYFLDTTSDIGIPSCVCVIVDSRGEEPMLVVGGGAGFDLKSTILRSGYEALNIFQFTDMDTRVTIPAAYEPFVQSSMGHRERIALWRGQDMLNRFAFFLAGRGVSARDFIAGGMGLSSSSEQLAYVLQQLNRLGDGYEVYVYEAENPVLRTLGYHVVKTIVPALLPLYLKENMATLNAPRLRSVPEKIGFQAATALNPLPHPFP